MHHILGFILCCREANLISLDPRAEYLEAVKVSYAAASALGGPQWINTSVLDFGLRYLSVLDS